ncbi:Prefoldin [Naematelia encephala]|uniref:Prefoldin n=1 Tax=Naematelia encephala TaxID=71784 RepID=A0A1Y2AYK8_9TREE|nr:Prefoldin [Naematelia encephala]
MAGKSVTAVQAELQSSSVAFQQMESDMASIIEARQRLDSQLSENELVLKEFSQLKPHNTIFKLVGPSLVPQDQAEAQQNVEKRLDFIKSEIKRVESQLKDSEEKTMKKKNEIIQLQQEFQALQASSSAAVPA